MMYASVKEAMKNGNVANMVMRCNLADDADGLRSLLLASRPITFGFQFYNRLCIHR